MTNRFDESVASLRDQFPDDLSEEDWNTLANVLLAYIWNDRFKSEIKLIEQDFLAERSVEFKQRTHDLGQSSTLSKVVDALRKNSDD